MKILSALSLILLLCSLGACGVKPRQVDPPDGQPSTFPRTYPIPVDE